MWKAKLEKIGTAGLHIFTHLKDMQCNKINLTNSISADIYVISILID